MPRLPRWIRTDLRTDEAFRRVNAVVAREGLNTVCSSARCPNRAECWNRGTATFMLLGSLCTRGCPFCAVPVGCPTAPDPDEPGKIAAAVLRLGLRHVVLTSVTRDDLPDGGAGHFAHTLRAIRRTSPRATVEVLTPDFRGSEQSLARVLESAPDIFAHNLETVRRLTGTARAGACYDRSLAVLRFAAAWTPAPRVKSGLMLGLGETEEEVDAALNDLVQAGCRALTLGQYLSPDPRRLPVVRFAPPEEFDRWATRARAMGFAHVASGPLVRSSYRADEFLLPAEEMLPCPAC